MSIDLASLLGTQETAGLEFKREATGRNAIRKAICALANDLPRLGGGDLIIGNFDRVNDYRNPWLAAAMKSLGYVNQFGRGIGRIRASVARNGNPPPEFVVDEASWTVTVGSAS